MPIPHPNPHIAKIIPYQIGKPIEELARETGQTDIVKLCSNENPLGASPLASHAAQLSLTHHSLYPDGGCYELKAALSAFYRVPASYFMIGNGSENLLEIIVKTFLAAHEEAILDQYTFATIPLVLKAMHIPIREIPAVNWGLDVEGAVSALSSRTKAVFVVNPNNPTGTYTSKPQFEKLLKAVPRSVLVVVDEAYAEYFHEPDYPNALDYLADHPNLIIVRTFSKAYGLAGLRVGYTIAHEKITDMLNRARLPFNVNSVGMKAATAALSDQDHISTSSKLNQQGLRHLTQAMSELKLDFIPSVANFLTVNVKDGSRVYQHLLNEGVIVRPLTGYGMPAHIRVSIGDCAQIQRFIDAIKHIIKEI